MLAKHLIRLDGFRGDDAQLAHAAREVRTHECNELVARVGEYPHAVLQPDEPCSLEKLAQLQAYLTSSFADVEEEDSPFPIPSYPLRYPVFLQEYALYACSPGISEPELSVCVLDVSALQKTVARRIDASIEFLAALPSAVRIRKDSRYLRSKECDRQKASCVKGLQHRSLYRHPPVILNWYSGHLQILSYRMRIVEMKMMNDVCESRRGCCASITRAASVWSLRVRVTRGTKRI